MLTQEKPLETTESITEIGFQHDPNYIEFKDWLALNYLEGKTLPDIGQQRTVVRLDHQQNSKITQVEIRSMLALENHSPFPLLNLSIYCRQSREKIFSVSNLPHHKTIQFKFIKPGSYHVRYFPAGTQNSVEQLITVSAKLPTIFPAPFNFSTKLKPSWL